MLRLFAFALVAAAVLASCSEEAEPSAAACGGQHDAEVCVTPGDSRVLIRGSGFEPSSTVKFTFGTENQEAQASDTGEVPAKGVLGIAIMRGNAVPKVGVTGVSADGTPVSFVVEP